MTVEKAYCHCFCTCFQNACIIRVYVMPTGFAMFFYCEPDILICSRLVFSPPPPNTSNFFYSCLSYTFSFPGSSEYISLKNTVEGGWKYSFNVFWIYFELLFKFFFNLKLIVILRLLFSLDSPIIRHQFSLLVKGIFR